MNTTTKQPTAFKSVIQPTPPALNLSKMGFDASKHCDPYRREEKDGTSYNPDIDNNNNLYNMEAFSIVRKREPDIERQCRLNEESGHGYVPDAVATFETKVDFYNSYYQDYEDSVAFYAQERLDYLEANYDDSWRYDKETYRRYGTNSDAYIEMVESGDIIDEGNSCKMGPRKMGASLSEEEMEKIRAGKDRSGSDIDNEADGQDIEAAAEDEPEAVTVAPSESEPAIESSVPISSAFAKASSPEKEPEAAAPEPVTIAPVPVAANNASYQMSA